MTLTDIGEGNEALHCMTNLTGVNGSVKGDWYFPNGTRVHRTNGNSEIHRTSDQMVVRMNRRGGGEKGIYHCEIPDAMDVNQSIYIGVYNTSSGEGHYSALLFCFNFILLCLCCDKEEIEVREVKMICFVLHTS